MRRIIIVGGGYAGLHAFKAIKSKVKNADVKLVSRDPYHTYHGWTGEVVGGRLEVERTLSPLAPLLDDGLVQGLVTSIDTDIGLVILSDGRKLKYDHLLIANGSRDPLEAIPGAQEHAWRLKDTHDMQRLSRRLGETPRPHKIVVVGGGMAGVEMASALAVRFGSGVVSLVSGTHLPLAHLEPRFRRMAVHARRLLERQGVVSISGDRVAAVESDRVLLSNGDALLSDLTLVTAGIALDIMPGTETFSRNNKKQIEVDEYFRVHGKSNIWAAGDIAAVPRPGRKEETCPVDALWAMKEGNAVGLNIARVIDGRLPVRFSYRGMGQAAGMMRRNGISELYGVQFTGLSAWLLRVVFFAWYMPQRSQGFSILLDILRRDRLLEDERSSKQPVQAEEV